MSVDILYQGLPIARASAVRLEGGNVFVEMDSPMPVATRLVLGYDHHRLEGRVQRIHEGVGAGIFFAPDGGALPDWLARVRPRTETVELEAEPEPAPAEPAQLAPAQLAPAQSAPAQSAPAAAPPAPAAAEDSEPAAAQAEAASPSMPPFEPTQEMAVPSLDDELRADDNGDAPSADRRSAKKKKSSRRR